MKFVFSKDFILNRASKSLIIDVKYQGYDMQLIVEYEVEEGKITKFDVWTGKERYGNRFFTFGLDNTRNKLKYETMEEMIEVVLNEFLMGFIDFDDIISMIESSEK